MLLMPLASSGYAQGTTGTISGVLVDQTRAAYPGVKVVIANVDTGQTREVVTNNRGQYTARLPVGNYDISLLLPNFQFFTVSGISLHVNDRLQVNGRLTIGAVDPLTVTAVHFMLPTLKVIGTMRTGATIEAFGTAARTEALSREHLRLTVRTLPERQALAYASSLSSALDLMLRLASTRPGDSQMSAAAWDTVIRARGMVLDEMAARHRSASAGEATEIAGLAEALTSARQRLAALTVRGIRNDPPERYRRLLEQARAERDRAERALAENSARFRDDQSRSRVRLAEVSAALPAESALVGFVAYRRQDLERTKGNTTPDRDPEPSYLAFVLRRGDSVPAVVPLGSAARIDAMILQWRRQLDQEAMAAGRSAKRGEAAYRRVAGELRQRIWLRHRRARALSAHPFHWGAFVAPATGTERARSGLRGCRSARGPTGREPGPAENGPSRLTACLPHAAEDVGGTFQPS
jgi:hypothetical protein